MGIRNKVLQLGIGLVLVGVVATAQAVPMHKITDLGFAIGGTGLINLGTIKKENN